MHVRQGMLPLMDDGAGIVGDEGSWNAAEDKRRSHVIGSALRWVSSLRCYLEWLTC